MVAPLSLRPLVWRWVPQTLVLLLSREREEWKLDRDTLSYFQDRLCYLWDPQQSENAGPLVEKCWRISRFRQYMKRALWGWPHTRKSSPGRAMLPAAHGFQLFTAPSSIQEQGPVIPVCHCVPCASFSAWIIVGAQVFHFLFFCFFLNTVFQKGTLGRSCPPAKAVAIRTVVMRRMTWVPAPRHTLCILPPPSLRSDVDPETFLLPTEPPSCCHLYLVPAGQFCWTYFPISKVRGLLWHLAAP